MARNSKTRVTRQWLPPDKGDKSIAYKAICLASWLSSSQKQIAASLIDHCNASNGRCDPSITRLADVLALSEATVKRGTTALSKHKGDHPAFFVKISHGGSHNTCAYIPAWSEFRAIVDAYEQKSRQKCEIEYLENSSEVSCSTAQPCAVSGSRIDTQTHSQNPKKKNNDEERSDQSDHGRNSQSGSECKEGTNRRLSSNLSRRFRNMKIDSPSRREVLRQRAETRLDKMLTSLERGALEVATKLVSSEVWEEAVQEEIRSGNGWWVIEKCLNK